MSTIRTLQTIRSRSLLDGLLLTLLFVLPVELDAQCGAETLPIIPVPSIVDQHAGTCIVTAATPIHFDTEFENEAGMLAKLLGSDPTKPTSAHTVIEFRRSEVPMGDEAYELHIEVNRIRVMASSGAGAYYAVQSIRQLLPSCIESGSRHRAWRLPCVSILDHPRFAWRGLMLDCCRHFMPIADVKRIIEQAASLKLNRFHWHLSDDQGWRLEIRAYPELTNVGAWRGDSVYRHGGFYTQEEVRDIVRFAAELHITIVPEIDLPGHTSAARASYAWLGCAQNQIPVPNDWGIFSTVLCVGRESTYRFVETVLEEVATLFPSRWIHVGGDECLRDEWETCDSCQTSIVRNGLPGTHALQWHFTQRVEEMLTRMGKIPIGWNEIMAGASSTTTVIQGWYNLKVAIAAATAGFSVISSPIDPCYLNYAEDINTLEDVYRFDPLAGQSWPDRASKLMGVECCLWTEAMPTPAESDRYIFPRIVAFAEAAWSDPSRKNWVCFRTRLGVHGGRWIQAGQRFSVHEDIPWDDGVPLTVHNVEPVTAVSSHYFLSDKMQGTPAILLHGEDSLVGNPLPAKILAHDDSSLHIELGFSPSRTRPRNAIREVYKASHPWCELSDSSSINGLYILPLLAAPRRGINVHCHPIPLNLDATNADLTVNLTLPAPGSAVLTLYDIMGRAMRREDTNLLPAGDSVIRFPLASIGAGIYIMRVSVLGDETFHKVLLTR